MKKKLMTNNQDCTHFLDKKGGYKMKNTSQQLLDKPLFRTLLSISMFTCGLFTLSMTLHILLIPYSAITTFLKNPSYLFLAREITQSIAGICLMLVFYKIYKINKHIYKNPICKNHVRDVKTISKTLLLAAFSIQISMILFLLNKGYSLDVILSPICIDSALLIAFALIIRVLAKILNTSVFIKEEYDLTI